jgi:hypothetical protein
MKRRSALVVAAGYVHPPPSNTKKTCVLATKSMVINHANAGQFGRKSAAQSANGSIDPPLFILEIERFSNIILCDAASPVA